MDKSNVNPFEDNIAHGILFGFIPHPLTIPDRPELDVYPFNVMFAQYKVENGKTIMGSSLYEPVLSSYQKEGMLCSMKYFNKYGPDSWLLIEYDVFKKSYRGQKYVRGISAGLAYGLEWRMFFVHFTALGLSNGERCEFKELGARRPQAPSS
jgi:hypothetical protein